MALTGQLSDMSLAELIEFFCNQRKTGRLKVDYHRGHGVFFIKEGELVDAKVGQLSGQEAVYFALTLPNAAFDFSPEVPPTRRTIEVAWTQVVLEGLRRLDEGLSPTESDAFGGWTPSESDLAVFMDQVERLGESSQASAHKDDASAAPASVSVDDAPLSMMVDSASAKGGSKKKWMAMGAAACIVLAVAVAAIPLLGGSSKPSAKSAAAASAPEPAAQTVAPASEAAATEGSSAETSSEATEAEAADASSEAARREREERERRLREQRERERRAAELAKSSESNQNTSAAAPAAAPAASGPKSVRVTVTYDEAGRVTAASFAGATPGAEAYASTAVRAARGRRFPAGKSGSTVVTIPVN